MAVPSRGEATIVTVPPVAARSFLRTFRLFAPESSRTLAMSFTAVRTTGGGVAATAPVVTLASADPLAVEEIRILAGAAARLGITAWPAANAAVGNPSMLRAGGATVSEEVARTVRVWAMGLKSAWVMVISSPTVPLKKAGTGVPNASRAAASFTQTAAGV